MNYIVLDLEWNQAPEGKIRRNKYIPCEIVEIGAVKLNEKKEVIGTFNELIKPQVYNKMHYVTREIIHINMEELSKMESFVTVVGRFLKWCGEDYIFCTWGPMDLTELQRNMNFYGVPSLTMKPLNYFDVQKLFSIAMNERRVRRTLEYAVDNLKIDKIIPFHRAECDAYYTAVIFRKISNAYVDKFYSIDVFETPKNKKEEISVVFDRYSKYISREFKTKEDALSDKAVKNVNCIVCNKSLKKSIKWFSPNGKTYYCEAFCNSHGHFRGKIRIKRSRNGNVFVIKTIKSISEDEVQGVKEKYIDYLAKKKDTK